MTDSEYLTTKEVAELLRLKERKVYDLAAEQSIPCTRATGKLLFPRVEVMRWLAQHSTGVSARTAARCFSGSHDPLLEWAIRESQCGLATLFDGSLDGCDRIKRGEASVAAIHVYHGDSDSWNLEYVRHHHNDGHCVLVRFLTRSRGVVFHHSISVESFDDVKNYAIAARQSGAGSQIVFESLLLSHGIDVTSLHVPLIARSELDAVLAVVEGAAQCTVGLQSVAAQHQLGYLHLMDESLDLLVDHRFWFEPEMQSFIEFCQSDAFAAKVNSTPGYQQNKLFSVLYNAC